MSSPLQPRSRDATAQSKVEMDNTPDLVADASHTAEEALNGASTRRCDFGARSSR